MTRSSFGEGAVTMEDEGQMSTDSVTDSVIESLFESLGQLEGAQDSNGKS